MREHIISEIKRLTNENGGRAPGSRMFEKDTGVTEKQWRGKLWARWSDALVDAGCQPNAMTGRTDIKLLLTGIVTACRHYGRIPTYAEIALLRNNDPSVPSVNVIRNNLQSQAGMLEALSKLATNDPIYADIVAMLPDVIPVSKALDETSKPREGHVYLIKSGSFYKVGRSDQLERRVKEIRVALPEAAELLHAIATDDPPGIEQYWHHRFADRRANGEWFKLTPADVKAFVRRKFQ